jgi:hypothetical protein
LWLPCSLTIWHSNNWEYYYCNNLSCSKWDNTTTIERFKE